MSLHAVFLQWMSKAKSNVSFKRSTLCTALPSAKHHSLFRSLQQLQINLLAVSCVFRHNDACRNRRYKKRYWRPKGKSKTQTNFLHKHPHSEFTGTMQSSQDASRVKLTSSKDSSDQKLELRHKNIACAEIKTSSPTGNPSSSKRMVEPTQRTKGHQVDMGCSWPAQSRARANCGRSQLGGLCALGTWPTNMALYSNPWPQYRQWKEEEKNRLEYQSPCIRNKPRSKTLTHYFNNFRR